MELKALLVSTNNFLTKDQSTLYSYSFLVDGELLKLYTQQPVQLPKDALQILAEKPIPVKITLEFKVRDGVMKPKLIEIV